MAETVGFVGLGIMGRPMADNLSRSFPVIGFDVEESRAAGLPNVTKARGLSDLAARCSIVCLSLPSSQIVEGVTIGAGGLAESLAPGSLSSTSARTFRRCRGESPPGWLTNVSSSPMRR